MRRIATTLLAFGLTACGGDEDRQEVLSKLRGIGASTSPLVSAPSTPGAAPSTVEVTVFAAIPDGETATIEPYEDEPSPFAANLTADEMAIAEDSITYEAYPGFQILSFRAQLAVPDATHLARTGGAGQARYGFVLRSGEEEEKMVGSFLVYPEGAPELTWTNPTITAIAPAAGDVLGSDSDVDIAAVVADNNDEDLKIGWFASGGEIKNRRATSTTWETPDAGDHTLIFTARGKKSRGFAMQIVTVHTE